ncbi:hypothetical protein BFJ63_vAg20285 [Fusarium oxysporum f. sp. narcissi]|uniref:Lipoprotein n=1 Tax=Fusarium oxysporum f. sp. narcissi TaxID=451672 RepID=A0A4Q2UTL6_FUSOX|nr:hypothetical protein BFJ63_vAg20285 [Fusarium oxysporum f. sp. narcissi]
MHIRAVTVHGVASAFGCAAAGWASDHQSCFIYVLVQCYVHS